MKRLNSHKYNVLLLKDDVGKSKPTTRRLPNERHTFGKAEVRDAEGADKVTSAWQYSMESRIKVQDKDFKRLNKSALGMRATMAHHQNAFRQQTDIRIRHPSQARAGVASKAMTLKGGNTLGQLRYGGTGRQGLKKLAQPMVIPSDNDETFTYGAPLRPATPIKAVIGNFYGEIAGYEKKLRSSAIRQEDEFNRNKMLNPPKEHTRATAMATTHVNTSTMTKQLDNQASAKCLFKMKKFNGVGPRTSSKNPAYKPTKRSTSAIGTRPNPVLGGR